MPNDSARTSHFGIITDSAYKYFLIIEKVTGSSVHRYCSLDKLYEIKNILMLSENYYQLYTEESIRDFRTTRHTNSYRDVMIFNPKESEGTCIHLGGDKQRRNFDSLRQQMDTKYAGCDMYTANQFKQIKLEDADPERYAWTLNRYNLLLATQKFNQTFPTLDLSCPSLLSNIKLDLELLNKLSQHIEDQNAEGLWEFIAGKYMEPILYTGLGNAGILQHYFKVFRQLKDFPHVLSDNPDAAKDYTMLAALTSLNHMITQQIGVLKRRLEILQRHDSI